MRQNPGYSFYFLYRRRPIKQTKQTKFPHQVHQESQKMSLTYVCTFFGIMLDGCSNFLSFAARQKDGNNDKKNWVLFKTFSLTTIISLPSTTKYQGCLRFFSKEFCNAMSTVAAPLIAALDYRPFSNRGCKHRG